LTKGVEVPELLRRAKKDFYSAIKEQLRIALFPLRELKFLKRGGKTRPQGIPIVRDRLLKKAF
jgi:retron-type reverse transcriptase